MQNYNGGRNACFIKFNRERKRNSLVGGGLAVAFVYAGFGLAFLNTQPKAAHKGISLPLLAALFKQTFLNLFSFAFFIVVLFTVGVEGVFAQSGSGNLSSEGAVVGVPWIITVLVDHSAPDEVEVIAPVFPAFFYLDRYYKSPRLMDGQVVTAIEYTFLPTRAGTVRLGSFTVITPEGSMETAPFALAVRDPAAQARPLFPRLVWSAPAEAVQGESTVLELGVSGLPAMPSLQQLPAQRFFPEVPQGSILAILPLTENEREGGAAIRLNLIALEGDFILPAQIVRHENIVFEIPALYIRAAARRPESPANISYETQGENLELGFAAFPDFDFTEFGRTTMGRVWRAQIEEVYNTAQELWDNDLKAQALAKLRQNEREHPAGAWLRPVRVQAEESLGVFNTENENRQRRQFLLGLAFLIILIVIISPFVYFTLTRKSLWQKAVLISGVFFLTAAVFACLYLFTDSRLVFSGPTYKFGVTNSTAVRRSADYYGQEFFIFKEGQPVVIMLNSGYWVFVRTNDDKNSSGWVPADTVNFY
jgi:hypothetical protein